MCSAERPWQPGDWPDAARYTAQDFTPTREDLKNAYEEDEDAQRGPGGPRGGAQCQSQ